MTFRFVRFRYRFLSGRPLTMTALGAQPGPVEISIREKLTLLLQPITSMTINNESHLHRHHAAMKDVVTPGETHFSVEVVSNAFMGKNTLARHRMIHTVLAEEFAGGLHALSLKTKTPAETQTS